MYIRLKVGFDEAFDPPSFSLSGSLSRGPYARLCCAWPLSTCLPSP